MKNRVFRSVILKLLKRGKFDLTNKLLKYAVSWNFLLSKKILGGVWGNYLYLRFRKFSDHTNKTDAYSTLPEYDFKNKRVLVFLELNADARIVREMLSEADTISCYYEGRVSGIKNLVDQKQATYISLNETITPYDTNQGQQSLDKNTKAMDGIKKEIELNFSKNSQFKAFSGHSHAIAQSIDAKFLQTSLHCDTVMHLLETAEYDVVCLVVADGGLSPLLIDRMRAFVPDDNLFVACTRKSSVLNHRFFGMLERSFQKSGQKLSPVSKGYLDRRIARISKTEIPGRKAISREFSYAMKAFIERMPELGASESISRNPHVFFPFALNNAPVSEGIVELIESLFKTEYGISIVPQLLSSSAFSEVKEKEAKLVKKGVNFSLVCFKDTARNKRNFGDFMKAAHKLSFYILSRYMKQHRPFGKSGSYLDFFETPHFHAIVRDFSKTLMEILILQEFIKANKPKSVICYPSALPAARILTKLVKKVGSFGVDVQPFFVMDEPRTMFHHAKNGDYMFVQSAEFTPIYEKLGYDKKNIFVTGTPRTIDMLGQVEQQRIDFEKTDTGNEEAKTILFVDQITNREQVEQVLEFLLYYCKKNENVTAIYRPHYRQGKMNGKLEKKLEDTPNLILGSGHNIYKLIMSSDVVVTYYSNVALESAILERPVVNVYMNNKSYPEPLNLHEWGISQKATGFEELEGVVDDLLYNDQSRQKLLTQQQKFLRNNPQYTTPIAIENIEKQYTTILNKYH